MDEQNTKICSHCSTVNSADFTYCKNCGTELYSQAPADQYEPQSYLPPQYRHNAFYEKDGVDAKTMSTFVGKNDDIYLSKFVTMKLNNKKISWHWPVFILGAVLGPVGMAFWFFYRKMYKAAFLLLAIGTLLGFADLWTAFIHPLNTIIKEYGVEMFIGSAELSEATLARVGETFLNATHPLNTLVSALSAAVLLLLPMFTFNIYEKFALKRIKRMQALFEDQTACNHFIKSSGGTSTLAVVLSAIIYYVVMFIVYCVLTFIYALSITGATL